MEPVFTLKYVKDQRDIDFFWQKRDIYMKEDVLPNATFNPPTQEEWDWFFADEYYSHIMKLYHREVDPLKIVFFMRDGLYVGFAVYVIYHSEDSKCFIVEFCIESEYRNQQVGTEFFHTLKKQVIDAQASYLALNLSNEKNLRFWARQGFQNAGKDEYGQELYEYHPGGSGESKHK